MTNQYKPDIPTLIKKIVQEASLPECVDESPMRFTRAQLLELLVFVTVSKETIQDCAKKIEKVLQENS